MIDIEDDGPGISEAEPPHGFEPFHRLEESHCRETGTGLGPSIARSVVQAHGGDIV